MAKARTIAPTDESTANQMSLPGGPYGSYFTGAVVNLDANNFLDLVITDQGSSTRWPVPPGSALNMKNQRGSVLQIAIDPVNPGVSIAYQLTGKMVTPLTLRANIALEEDSDHFFRLTAASSGGGGGGIKIQTVDYTGNGNIAIPRLIPLTFTPHRVIVIAKTPVPIPIQLFYCFIDITTDTNLEWYIIYTQLGSIAGGLPQFTTSELGSALAAAPLDTIPCPIQANAVDVGVKMANLVSIGSDIANHAGINYRLIAFG